VKTYFERNKPTEIRNILRGINQQKLKYFERNKPTEIKIF